MFEGDSYDCVSQRETPADAHTVSVSLEEPAPSLFADNHFSRDSDLATLPVVNPATEQVIGAVPVGGRQAVETAVDSARRALTLGGWAQLTPNDRGKYLSALAAALKTREDEMGAIVTAENGMLLVESRVVNGYWPRSVYGYFASLAGSIEHEVLRTSRTGTVTAVRREPYGVVGIIVPWNAPQALLAFKLAPALLAGNTVVIKPAPETTLDMKTFAEAVVDAGIPVGVINFVTGDGSTGELLTQHPDVAKVAFTGSTAAGRAIASQCGRDLKPVTLELGGKSAAIVLDDADLNLVVDNVATICLPFLGQACWANTRILAPRDRYEDVVAAIAARLTALPIGDPLDETSVFGPLAAARHLERVEGYIKLGEQEGAVRVIGGSRPGHMTKGFYLEPTLFRDVDNRMRIAQEEIFGPVLCVIPYDTVDDAIRLSNASSYGLGGIIYTSDESRGLDVARRLETGTVGLNRYATDFGSPFGGYKSSGLGRELGPEGLESYIQYKSIYV